MSLTRVVMNAEQYVVAETAVADVGELASRAAPRRASRLRWMIVDADDSTAAVSSLFLGVLPELRSSSG